MASPNVRRTRILSSRTERRVSRCNIQSSLMQVAKLASLSSEAVLASIEMTERSTLLVDIIIIILLALLLLAYETLREFLGGKTSRVKILGIAIVPLLITSVIILAARWSELQS